MSEVSRHCLTRETVEHVSSDQSEGIPADGEIGRDGGFGGKGEGVVEIARSSRFAEDPQDMPTGRKVLEDGNSTGIAGCGDEGSIGAVEFGAQAIPAGSGKIEETRTGEFEEVGMHGGGGELVLQLAVPAFVGKRGQVHHREIGGSTVGRGEGREQMGATVGWQGEFHRAVRGDLSQIRGAEGDERFAAANGLPRQAIGKDVERQGLAFCDAEIFITDLGGEGGETFEGTPLGEFGRGEDRDDDIVGTDRFTGGEGCAGDRGGWDKSVIRRIGD